MQYTWIVAAALGAASLVAVGAEAQLANIPAARPPAQSRSSAAEHTPSAPMGRGVGPTYAAAALSPRVELSDQSGSSFAAPDRPFGLSQTLMIVGGAALLTGAIIGDDAGTVLMVAGAGVGLYGLYLFLREPPGAAGQLIGVGYELPVAP